jgi:WD40 repeat protein
MTGELLRTITGGGTQVTFSPDNMFILTNGNGFTKLFRASDGELLAQFLAGEGHMDSTFAPDGQIIATVGSDAATEESIRIFTAAGELLHELIFHTGASVNGARFTPDGQVLLTANLRAPGIVRRISTESGEVLDVLPGFDTGISAFDLAPNGQQFAAGSAEGFILLRDALDGTIDQTLDASAGRVQSMAFDPNGLRLASTHQNGDVVIWNLKTGAPEHTVPLNALVRDVYWSPDGEQIVVAGTGLDGVLKIDADTGQSIASFPTFAEQLAYLAVSQDEPALVAISGYAPSAQIRTAKDGTLVREISDIQGIVNGLGLSPDGSKLYIVDSSSTGRVISVDDGSVIDTFPVTETLLSRPVVFTDDGTLYADTLFSDPLTIRDVDTGTLIASLPSTLVAEFSPDNQLIAGAFSFGTGSIRIWRLDDLTTLPTITVGQNTRSMAFSPDSSMLAVGTTSGDMFLFNVEDGQLIHSFDGTVGQIPTLEFSPDGTVLASANQFAAPKISLWDVSDGKLILEYDRDTGNSISKLVATPDGQFFVAIRRDATAMTFRNPLAQTPGDTDGDGDVDLVDFAQFQLCFTGPGAPLADGCDSVDFDNDNDVDLADFGEFQLAFTGAI